MSPRYVYFIRLKLEIADTKAYYHKYRCQAVFIMSQGFVEFLLFYSAFKLTEAYRVTVISCLLACVCVCVCECVCV